MKVETSVCVWNRMVYPVDVLGSGIVPVVPGFVGCWMNVVSVLLYNHGEKCLWRLHEERVWRTGTGALASGAPSTVVFGETSKTKLGGRGVIARSNLGLSLAVLTEGGHLSGSITVDVWSRMQEENRGA